METKNCSKCKLNKPLSDFYIAKRTGREIAECKDCKILYNKQRKKNERDVSISHKTCKLCKELKTSDNFSDNYLIKDGISNVCKKCTVNKSKDYESNNKDKVIEYRKNYRNTHKEETSQYNQNYKPIKLIKAKQYRAKHLSKSENRFRKNVRNLILDSFKRVLSGSVKKSSKSEDILGCTLEEFLIHIESLFEEGMSFENHGQCRVGDCNVWHIDHKIPISSAKTEEDIIKLCHYTNLQPLWASDNLSKGKKLI